MNSSTGLRAVPASFGNEQFEKKKSAAPQKHTCKYSNLRQLIRKQRAERSVIFKPLSSTSFCGPEIPRAILFKRKLEDYIKSTAKTSEEEALITSVLLIVGVATITLFPWFVLYHIFEALT